MPKVIDLWENLLMARNKEVVSCTCPQLALSTRVLGVTILLEQLEKRDVKTELFIVVSSKICIATEMVGCNSIMAQFIRVNGKIQNNMAQALNHTLMAAYTSVSSQMARDMVEDR